MRARSIASRSSLLRSKGIVVTAIPPALITANQHAAVVASLKPRISTRFPGTRPRSSRSTPAMRFASSRNSA